MTTETLDLLELIAKALLDGIQKYRVKGTCSCDASVGKAVVQSDAKTKKRGALKMMLALLKESQKPLNKKQLHNALKTKFAAIVTNGALSQAINTGLKTKVLQRTGRATYTIAAAQDAAAQGTQEK